MTTKPYKNIEKFINKRNYCSMFLTKEEDRVGRNEIFKEQRKKYGFDERETWDMGFTTILWLYSHLERYKTWSIVELYSDHAHHYVVSVFQKDGENEFIWNKKKEKYKKEKKDLSLGQIIDTILEYFEIYLEDQENLDNYVFAKEGMKLYGEILPSLWW